MAQGVTAGGPARRTRSTRGRAPEPAQPLGSLSQPGGAALGTAATCSGCGGSALTQLRMTLGDGSPVVFVSCHACEIKVWFHAGDGGAEISRDEVLVRSAKR